MKRNEKLFLEVKDVPYTDVSIYLLNGSIEQVVKNVLDIKDQLLTAYKQREENFPNEKFTPFELYEDIRLDVERDYNSGIDIFVRVFRHETDEEFKTRLLKEKSEKKARKEREAKKQLEFEEKERALYEELKKKFEPNL